MSMYIRIFDGFHYIGISIHFQQFQFTYFEEEIAIASHFMSVRAFSNSKMSPRGAGGEQNP